MSEREELIVLADRLKKGDDTVFNRIYQILYNEIYYLALKYTKSHEDALDVLQNTFLAIYNGIGKLKSEKAFHSWVCKIVYIQCIKSFHAKKMVLLDGTIEHILETMEENTEEFLPGFVLEQEDAKEKILEIVNDLPKEQAMSVVLYYYQQKSVGEIAEIMDCPTGTIKSRLNYARKIMQKRIEKYAQKGVEVYSVGGLPILTRIFIEAAQNQVLSPDDAKKIWLNITEATGVAAAFLVGEAAAGGAVAVSTTTATAAATTTIAATTMGMTGGILSTLAARVTIAAIVTVSAATGGVYMATKGAPPPESEAVPAIVENIATPSPTGDIINFVFTTEKPVIEETPESSPIPALIPKLIPELTPESASTPAPASVNRREPNVLSVPVLTPDPVVVQTPRPAVIYTPTPNWGPVRTPIFTPGSTLEPTPVAPLETPMPSAVPPQVTPEPSPAEPIPLLETPVPTAMPELTQEPPPIPTATPELTPAVF
jgi:RNA polymerase sigma factor, sigma-70 family